MPTQDTSSIKEKIINFLRTKGPSLPVHISKEIDQSILFTSAFLSELLAERRLRISNMRIGSSKLNYLEGQESKLIPFAEQYLKSKEKDAFLRLKERKFLKDSEQEPPIRVALRSIKDFAFPFTDSRDQLVWRFLTSNQSDYETKPEPKPDPIQQIQETPKPEPKQEIKPEPEQTPQIKEETNQETKEEPKEEEEEEEKKELDIFDKSEEKTEKEKESKKQEEPKTKPKPKKKTTKKKTTSSKANEKFFEIIKEYLQTKNWEILDLIGFSKTDISLKINANNQEKLLVSYNKKRLAEKDLLNAYKKAKELDLPYIILSKGDLPKKIESLMEALNKLDSVQKIE